MELWTTIEAATWWGVTPGTYRDYVSKGYAPVAVEARDPVTGMKLHDATKSRAAFEARRGQGARTDLEPVSKYELLDWYQGHGAQRTSDPWRWQWAAADAHERLYSTKHPRTLTRQETAAVWAHAEAAQAEPS